MGLRQISVVYRDFEQGIRRCRGIRLIEDDPLFLELVRMDGQHVKFNRTIVLKVEVG